MMPVTDTDVDAAFATLVANLIEWGDGIRLERLRVVAEYVDHGRQVRVLCPFCKRRHYHGAASGGHRIAHCGRGGYVLALTESTTTTERTRCHVSS